MSNEDDNDRAGGEFEKPKDGMSQIIFVLLSL